MMVNRPTANLKLIVPFWLVFTIVQCLPEQLFVDSVLHEVAAIDVDNRDLMLVLLKPFLVRWVIDILFFVNEL